MSHYLRDIPDLGQFGAFRPSSASGSPLIITSKQGLAPPSPLLSSIACLPDTFPSPCSNPPPSQAISFESEEEAGMLGDMPFMALETRNSRTGNRLRMTSDEALEVMFGLRAELEVRIWVGQGETKNKLHFWHPCVQQLQMLADQFYLYPHFVAPYPLVSLTPASLALL